MEDSKHSELPWGLEFRLSDKKREYSVIEIIVLGSDTGGRRYNVDTKAFDKPVPEVICEILWIGKDNRKKAEANAHLIVNAVNAYKTPTKDLA